MFDGQWAEVTLRMLLFRGVIKNFEEIQAWKGVWTAWVL